MKVNEALGIGLIILCGVIAIAAGKEEPDKPPPDQNPNTGAVMNNERLAGLIRRVDPDVKGNAGHWVLKYNDIPLYVITDEHADRMRIMTPITEAANIKSEVLYRMLQANFDSALDARYAIAQDRVWSVFLHPLSTLSDKDFFSGLAQTAVAMKTFGTSYSSGALIFQGGDSQDEHKRLYEEILQKGMAI